MRGRVLWLRVREMRGRVRVREIESEPPIEAMDMAFEGL
jgi:hypothetical protein